VPTEDLDASPTPPGDQRLITKPAAPPPLSRFRHCPTVPSRVPWGSSIAAQTLICH